MLKYEFDAFSKSFSEISEMSSYWEGRFKNVDYLHDLITADREADCGGHSMAVPNLYRFLNNLIL